MMRKYEEIGRKSCATSSTSHMVIKPHGRYTGRLKSLRDSSVNRELLCAAFIIMAMATLLSCFRTSCTSYQVLSETVSTYSVYVRRTVT